VDRDKPALRVGDSIPVRVAEGQAIVVEHR
jgi:hypothetical protein